MMLSIPVDWKQTQTYQKCTGSPLNLRDLVALIRQNSASRHSRSDLSSKNYQYFDAIQSPNHTNKTAASTAAMNTSTPPAPAPEPAPTPAPAPTPPLMMRQQQAYYKAQYATYKKDGKILSRSLCEVNKRMHGDFGVGSGTTLAKHATVHDGIQRNH
jgi:hypothetical protein